ncbi:MAG: hypothetical protein AB7P04_10085 [Bacteriovoracia bacterium]
MRTSRGKIVALSLLAASLEAMVANPAQANVGGRASFAILGWGSKFSQSNSAQSVNVSTLLSMGLNATFGIQAHAFFLEWSPQWLMTRYGSDPRDREGSFYALTAFQAGLTLGPIEPYVGFSSGSYSFSSGVESGFGGSGIDLGANIYLAQDKLNLGLKAQFKRIFIGSDSAGAIPTSITTRADIYIIGFFVGLK